MTVAYTPAIIPFPASISVREGVFRLSASTRIVVDHGELTDVADYLAALVGIDVIFGNDTTDGDIVFDRRQLSGGEESYEIDISSDQIVIRSNCAEGAFRAVQSLRQLLPEEIEAGPISKSGEWQVPAVAIADHPRFGYRGMHLDVSRHFFPVEFVKRFLDWMALYKLNYFHWHLTDDQGWRIEIQNFPDLTATGAWRSETVTGHTLSRTANGDGERHGGFYTQDDIREIVDYAARRFITVVPEIDMPGHSSALLAAYPEYGCRDGQYEVATRFGIFRAVLCPCDATFRMVETVLGEVAELFPGPYIHIGGDEADKSDWQECSRCRQVMKENNLANVDELHRHFVRRLNAVVTGLGRTMIGWDDILEGGRTQASTVTVWRGDDNVSAALRGGHNVIVTPPEFYFDYYQSTSVDEPLAIHGITTLRDSYEFELVPGAVPDSARRQVLGAQGTLWTEYVTTESHAEYMCLPRMCALAEQVWSNPERKSWASFIARLRPHFQRFDVLGVNASRSVYNVYTHYAVQTDRSLRVSLHCDGDNHAIRYTLDGSAPGPGSAEFGTDLLLDQSTCIRACAQDRSSQALFGDTRLQFEHHKAIGCPVTFAHPPEQIWPGDPERVVVDGVLASLGFFLHRDWAGFAGQDLDAVIDLQMPMYIGEAGVGFDVAYHRRLYPPTGIEVELSNDGSKWVSVARLDDSDIDAERGRVVASFPDQEARYVRVRARNEQQVFSHECAGPAPVSLYVDEIVIR